MPSGKEASTLNGNQQLRSRIIRNLNSHLCILKQAWFVFHRPRNQSKCIAAQYGCPLNECYNSLGEYNTGHHEKQKVKNQPKKKKKQTEVRNLCMILSAVLLLELFWDLRNRRKNRCLSILVVVVFVFVHFIQVFRVSVGQSVSTMSGRNRYAKANINIRK